jgi:aspartate/methionine/tyrosine aminotransferase
VTSPNNPDGALRIPITSAPIILWDAVYAWPWYGFTLMKLLSQMKKACTNRMCIPIFSFSKTLGLAGERVGYALIPPSVQKAYPGLVSSYQYYISTSTGGTCRPGEGVCRVIATGYKEFPLITERLEQRYDAVTVKLKDMLPEIEILSPRGFPYLWIRYPGIHLHEKLLTLGIRGLPGTSFNATTEYVRLSLLISSETLNQVLTIKG